MQISAASRSAETLLLKTATAPRSTRPSAPSAIGVDRVSLSPEALTRSASSSGEATSVESSSSISRMLSANPSRAESLVRDLAYEEDRPLMNISGWPVIRYAATGEIETPESAAAFAKQAASIREGRIALFEREKASGAPTQQIYDAIAAYMSKQPSDFLQHTGWARTLE